MSKKTLSERIENIDDRLYELEYNFFDRYKENFKCFILENIESYYDSTHGFVEDIKEIIKDEIMEKVGEEITNQILDTVEVDRVHLRQEYLKALNQTIKLYEKSLKLKIKNAKEKN